ncbi:MAG: shikimate kinase [Brevundimonas sp. 12-68-7]|uniref:Shikimate kinase n=2 Tax=Brevundimonas TaxID=41275 RepID=A0ABV1NNL0_9CAUL|nr:MAG: shikimate kinase [Brevundimonas sp. 12-68-7]OYX34219.1 MAG: shikimate kinase [Brevundimonas subvibrioides]
MSGRRSANSVAPDARPSRTIALVGLMGVGKSTVGRRLAQRLDLPFIDGDEAIESAARMTVSDIFSQLGEAEFRAGEARVMRRLLDGPPIVLATGGGAVLNPGTRALMRERATTVWLRADLAIVASRVQRRDTRPLLRGKDPLQALSAMAEVRYPIYAETADLTVDVGAGAHAQAVDAIVTALTKHWAQGQPA